MSNRRRAQEKSFDLDSGMLIFGMFTGMLVGGVVALFKAPRSGEQTRDQITGQVSQTTEDLKSRIDQVTADPVAESMAEGKAAARRRRIELGLETEG